MPGHHTPNQSERIVTVEKPKIWRTPGHLQFTAHQICKWFAITFNTFKRIVKTFLSLLHFPKDKKADLVISTYVDDILEKVLKRLGVELPEYTTDQDPTKQKFCELEWTISKDSIKHVEKLYDEKLKSTRKRKLNGGNKNDADGTKQSKKPEKEEPKEEKVKIETTNGDDGDDTAGR